MFATNWPEAAIAIAAVLGFTVIIVAFIIAVHRENMDKG